MSNASADSYSAPRQSPRNKIKSNSSCPPGGWYGPPSERSADLMSSELTKEFSKELTARSVRSQPSGGGGGVAHAMSRSYCFDEYSLRRLLKEELRGGLLEVLPEVLSVVSCNSQGAALRDERPISDMQSPRAAAHEERFIASKRTPRTPRESPRRLDVGIWQDPPHHFDDRQRKVDDIPRKENLRVEEPAIVRETAETEVALRVEEPCSSRWPKMGDRVRYHQDEKYRQKNGWELARGGVGVVTRVDREGDFKMENIDGIESPAWNYRKFFVYCHDAQVTKSDEVIEVSTTAAVAGAGKHNPFDASADGVAYARDPSPVAPLETLQKVDDLTEPEGEAELVLGYTPIVDQEVLSDLSRRLNMPEPVTQTVEWFATLEEPERSGTLAHIVYSHHFEVICTIVIVFNALLTFFSTNWSARNPGQVSDVFRVLEILFLLFYCGELCLKLAVHRLYLFWNEHWHWNTFDCFLVCTSLYDLVQTSMSQGDSSRGGIGMVFLRTLRLLKMARVLRMFRMIRSLAVLRLMLQSLLGSMPSLFWSLVMMLLIFYMFGLVFVQNASEFIYLNGETMTQQDLSDLQQNFGSVERAILSLFMATTGGDDWAKFYHMVRPIGLTSSVIYLFFVAFTQIALMNILTGIFVENAMKLAEPDRLAQYSAEQKDRLKQTKELERIMKEVDGNDTGTITSTEFHQEMIKPKGKLRVYLGSMGIHEGDAERFFMMLQTNNFGRPVAIPLFVNGCLRLQGGAQSLDIQALTSQVSLIHQDVREFKKIISSADVREFKKIISSASSLRAAKAGVPTFNL